MVWLKDLAKASAKLGKKILELFNLHKILGCIKIFSRDSFMRQCFTNFQQHETRIFPRDHPHNWSLFLRLTVSVSLGPCLVYQHYYQCCLHVRLLLDMCPATTVCFIVSQFSVSQPATTSFIRKRKKTSGGGDILYKENFYYLELLKRLFIFCFLWPLAPHRVFFNPYLSNTLYIH